MDTPKEDRSDAMIMKSLLSSLTRVVNEAILYFQDQNDRGSRRFLLAFGKIHAVLCNNPEHRENLPGSKPFMHVLFPIIEGAYKFDIDQNIKANGVRTIVLLVKKCVLHLIQLCRHIYNQRSSTFFHATRAKTNAILELEAYSTAFQSLDLFVHYLHILISLLDEGDLFLLASDKVSDDLVDRVFIQISKINQEPFFGRCLGFQYCQTVQSVLTTICVSMAAYNKGFKHSGMLTKLASSVINGGKYMMQPEARGKQLAQLVSRPNVQFCKAFWDLNENIVITTLPTLMCPKMAVNKVLVLDPEVFTVTTLDGETLTIQPPSAHSGPAPVFTRLLSYTYRQGQESLKSSYLGSSTGSKAAAPARTLIIHIHGGGFVSQSSKSHETYLRHWARAMNCPVLSIDYSLAPDNPFPRATEECFYVYCWAITHCHMLGSTADCVLLVGDSAGGNLILSTSLRAASFHIRKPDGLLAMYPAALAKVVPSPSRMLGLLDPLIPLGVQAGVLAAYAGVDLGPVSSVVDFGAKQSVSMFEFNPATKANMRRSFSAGQIDRHTSTPVQFNLGSNSDDEQTRNEQSSIETESRVEPKSQEPAEGQPEETSVTRECSSQEQTDTASVKSRGQSSDMSRDQTTDTSCDQTTDTCEQTTGTCEQTAVLPHDSSRDYGVLSDRSPTEDHPLQQQPATITLTNGLQTADTHPLQFGEEAVESEKSDAESEQSSGFEVLGDKISTPSVENDLEKVLCDMFPLSEQPCSTIDSHPLSVLRRLPVADNMYMSPYLAPDELLSQLPNLHIIVSELDPLLDDSIMLVKKLRRLNHSVQIDVVRDLPHGFLNFALVSETARRASELAVARMKRLISDCLQPDLKASSNLGQVDLSSVVSSIV